MTLRRIKERHVFIFVLISLALGEVFIYSIEEVLRSNPAILPHSLRGSGQAQPSRVEPPSPHRDLLRHRLEEGKSEHHAFTWPPTPSPPHGYHPGGSYENTSSNDTIPAIMVGVASSVIVCAVALYISDLRDRWHHERMLLERRHRREIESSKQMETLASSGYWVSAYANSHEGPRHPFPMLPPPNNTDQPEYVEDISLSPVSTMTVSLAMESGCLHRVDSDNLEESVDITELADSDRVGQGTDLSSFIELGRLQTMACTVVDGAETRGKGGNVLVSKQSDSSVTEYTIGEVEDEEDSGWASRVCDSTSSSEVSIGTYLRSVTSAKSRSSSVGSNGRSSSKDSESGEELHGETCFDEEEEASKIDSLERSPDTPMEGDQREPRNELAQLEALCIESLCSVEETERMLEATNVISEQSPLERMIEGSAHMRIVDNSNEMLQEGRDDDDEGVGQDYVRNIFFVPISMPSAPTGLGIEVDDATSPKAHPCVKTVCEESPLYGRLFAGDTILAVNNQDTVGLPAVGMDQKLTSEERDGDPPAGVIKLTVLSAQADGSDSECTSIQDSIDTGTANSAIEV